MGKGEDDGNDVGALLGGGCIAFVDKGAAALHPVDDPHITQSIERLYNRGAADVKLFRQLLFRGKLGILLVNMILNLFLYVIHDLAIFGNGLHDNPSL